MRRTATAAAIASAFAAAVAVAVAPASASTSAVAHGSARRGANGEQITFGDVTCAPGWPAPQPGRDRF
jgi:hypothetical protein